MIKIIIPLPSKDFDPSDTAIPWKILKDFQITFATPDGKISTEDKIMMTGEGLGIFYKLLMADKNGRAAMDEMKKSKEFLSPISYGQIKVNDYDGIFLPGGHAPGMKVFLESALLQQSIADFYDAGKAIGAICHGVVLAARSTSKNSGKSILFEKQVTALPKFSELLAWNLTKKKLGNYYRTNPFLTVEDEVKKALKDPGNFTRGPPTLFRDSANSFGPGYIVVDGNLITARWPGDAHTFGQAFKQLLLKKM